jgi:two-component system, chemotaxis family, sensor kinase CheA
MASSRRTKRVACGKPAVGRIALRARREGSRILIEIEDDGRGIDWDGVRAKASGLGLLGANHADLVRALVRGGVSTAAEVTDLSGRGVGMGALRAAVQELEGELDIQSEAGCGTCLRMVFPVRGFVTSSDVRSECEYGGESRAFLIQ